MQLVMSSNIQKLFSLLLRKFALASILVFGCASIAQASDFNHPWRNTQKALVIDAYEKNPIDWNKMVKDKRIRAFIGKSSDGLASPYSCSGNATKKQICKKSFQNYFMKQQLYHTRKALAKALGLKWGAYHLGRPGNPIAQANHFISFAKPEKDELIALDIEHDDPKKWISFKDAEIFARQVYKRIGRYPVLYTNHDTARRIAARRAEFPLLSRLPLWYARFKGDIRGSFPMGNWDKYTLWQFSAHPNCNKRRCLYRVPGTETNIDVNVSTLTIAEFDKAWPFNGLVPKKGKKPEQFLVENEADKPEINVAAQEIKVADLLPRLLPKDKILEHLNPDETFQVTSISLDDMVIPTPRIQQVDLIQVAKEVQKPIVVAALEDNDVKSDAVLLDPTFVAAIPTKAVREPVLIAAVVPTAAVREVLAKVEEQPEPTVREVLAKVEEQAEPAVREALAKVEEPELAIETSSYGITTTDYEPEPEYGVVIPKSEHTKDLTMQLQYLSGAL